MTKPMDSKNFRCNGWDYQDLYSTYKSATEFTRKQHKPSLIHVEEITQPQGHSTSGSHERYKSKERLTWAKEFDCISKFKEWLLSSNNGLGKPISTLDELNIIEKEAKAEVKSIAKEAWKEFIEDIETERKAITSQLELLSSESGHKEELQKLISKIKGLKEPLRKELYQIFKSALRITIKENTNSRKSVLSWYEKQKEILFDKYNSNVYNTYSSSSLNKGKVAPTFDSEELIDGRLILRNNFRTLFKRHPEILTFGEDTGKIGGVNQAMEGMQEEFGEIRVFDTGIREASIIGQGIGLALRGLRPIAEIQYLDYLLYAIQIMSDDISTLAYRTKGSQNVH